MAVHLISDYLHHVGLFLLFYHVSDIAVGMVLTVSVKVGAEIHCVMV